MGPYVIPLLKHEPQMIHGQKFCQILEIHKQEYKWYHYNWILKYGSGRKIPKLQKDENQENEQIENDQKSGKKPPLQFFIYQYEHKTKLLTHEQHDFYENYGFKHDNISTDTQKDVQYVIRAEGLQQKQQKNDQFSDKKLQFCITRDYMVIKQSSQIYFCKLKDIKNAQLDAIKQIDPLEYERIRKEELDQKKKEAENQKKSKDEVKFDYIQDKKVQVRESLLKQIASELDDSQDKAKDQSDNPYKYLSQLISNNLCEIEMTVIDTDRFLNDRIKKNSFIVSYLNKKQRDVIYDLSEKNNVVQIMFGDMSIVWDLDQNREIIDIISPQQFSKPETYATLGINVNLNDKPEAKKEQIVVSNKSETLFIQPKTNEDQEQLFRLFTMLDLAEMDDHLQRDQKPDDMDREVILANLYGKTYFEILRDKPKILKQICDFEELNEDNLIKQSNDNDFEYDDIYVRRLHATLQIPLTESKSQENYKWYQHHLVLKERFMLRSYDRSFLPRQTHSNLFHEALRSNDNDKKLILEALLGLNLKSSEVHMIDVIDELEDLQLALQYNSKEINQFLEVVFRESEMSKEVQYVKWRSKYDQIAFGSNTSQLSVEKIKDEIDNTFDIEEKSISIYHWIRRIKSFCGSAQTTITHSPVLVQILDVSWLQGKMHELYSFMAKIENQEVFDMPIVQILLTKQRHSFQLAYKVFLPWCIYFIIAQCYLGNYSVIHYHEQNYDKPISHGWETFMQVTMLIGDIVFLIIEVMQINKFGTFHYLTDIWNLIYLLMYLLNISLLIVQTPDGELVFDSDLATTLASVDSMLLWIGLLYWLRFVKIFSKYIYLIEQTFKDILTFMIIFLIILFTFANGLYILDQNQDENKVIDSVTNSGFINAVINQYLLGLGEFASLDENYTHYQLVWIMFLSATFITNIVFLNMLIAIMGDTYGKVSEKWERSALIEVTQMFADYWFVIKFAQQSKNRSFMYVVSSERGKTEDENEMISQLQEKVRDNFQKACEAQQKLSEQFETSRILNEISANKQQRDLLKIKDELISANKQQKDEMKEIKEMLRQHLQK